MYSTYARTALRRRTRHMYLVHVLATLSPLWVLLGSLQLSSLLLSLAGSIGLFIAHRSALARERPLSLVQRWAVGAAAGVLLHWAWTGTAAYPAFTASASRDSSQLNEGRLFLALLALSIPPPALALKFAPPPVAGTIRDRLAARLVDPTRAAKLARQAAVHTAVFWLAYLAILRTPFVRFIAGYSALSPPGTKALLRPHLHHLLRSSAPLYSLHLGFTALTQVLAILWTRESVSAIFEVYATQPISVTELAGKAENQVLVQGLHEGGYYGYLAFQELSQFALLSPARRQRLFKDSFPRTSVEPLYGPSSSPPKGAWHAVSRACMLRLGRARMALREAHGTAPPPPAKTSALPAAAGQKTLPPVVGMSGTTAALVKRDVDVFASGAGGRGAAAPANGLTRRPLPAPAAGATAPPPSTALSNGVPSLLRPSDPLPPSSKESAPVASTSTAGLAAATPAAPLPNLRGLLASIPIPAQVRPYLPAPVLAFLSSPKGVTAITLSSNDFAVLLLAVQALADLVCASRTEDEWGTVQRDKGAEKVLEAFVGVLEELPMVPAAGAEAELDLRAALKDGITAILDEFQPYLKELRFPVQVALKLREVADWG